jgi:hypothetical protein
VLAVARERRVSLELTPVLLGALARGQLELGHVAEARAAAIQAVETVEARSLDRVGITAPVVLARVLMATEGAAAAGAIELHLDRALELARSTKALVQEPKIHVEFGRLARMQGDEARAASEEAEAERILAEMGAPRELLRSLREEETGRDSGDLT